MTATVTIDGRRLPLPVADPVKVREIADAVAVWTQRGVDAQLRVARPKPTPNARRVETVFRASQVAAISANGIDLTDVPSPLGTVEAVAA